MRIHLNFLTALNKIFNSILPIKTVQIINLLERDILQLCHKLPTNYSFKWGLQGTTVLTKLKYFQVMHPQIEPSNIVYRVTEGPYHGWLEVTTTLGSIELESYNEEPVHIVVFDQSIINANRLVYVQSGVNRTRDRIRMDVTNGIVWLRDVEIAIIIIPEHFYVSAGNLTVVEGASVSLRPDSFRTKTEYYKGKVVSYKVTQKPKFGKIMMSDQELDVLPVLKLNSGNILVSLIVHLLAVVVVRSWS